MQKPYQLALHIFRRDLRLQDNTALIEALQSSTKVIPCFIFDTRQIEHNNYKSDHCIQFMINSLQNLNTELKKKKSKLYFFHGIAEEVIKKLIKTVPIDAVFINRDYTPFSKKRDKHIEKICKQQKVAFHSFGDALLHEPGQILKANRKPYAIFTPYFHKASQFSVSLPQKNNNKNYYKKKITLESDKVFNKLMYLKDRNLAIQGGRIEALELLKNIGKLKNYAKIRNFPALNGTTKLSAHNKFGTLSIRELYNR